MNSDPIRQAWTGSWIVVWRVDPMRPGDYWIRNCGSGPGAKGNAADYIEHIKKHYACEFVLLTKGISGGWIRRAERPDVLVEAGLKMETVTARLPVTIISHLDKITADHEWKSRSQAIRELIHFALIAGGMPLDNEGVS